MVMLKMFLTHSLKKVRAGAFAIGIEVGLGGVTIHLYVHLYGFVQF